MTAVEQWPVLEAVPNPPDDLVVIESDATPEEPGNLPAVVEPSQVPSVRPDRESRPILPSWMDSPQIFLRYVRTEAHYAYQSAGYHAVRLVFPYYVRLLFRAPVGFGRAVRAWFRWVTVAWAVDYLKQLTHAESGPFSRVFNDLKTARTVRWLVTCAGLLILIGGWTWAEDNLRTWALWAIGLSAIGLFGFLGRDNDHRILDYANYATPRLTYELLLNALGSLGITQLNKSLKDFGAAAVPFRSPIGYKGKGWQVEMDLPAGVPAAEVVAKRDRLAAGLNRASSAVWPSTDPDQAANRLVLYVSEHPLSKMKPFVWPLARTGQTSVFEPIIVGQDPMGDPVSVTLMFNSLVCGAQPRKGKTFSLRVLALGAALDPTCELHIYDLKGGADWRPFEPVAYRFRAGEGEEDFEYLLEDLREMVADMQRRYQDLGRLPRSQVPEGKITPELAARKDLGLHPVLLVLDETQTIYVHPTHGKEITKLVSDLTRKGPAAGIMVHSATQRVSKQTIPISVSSNASLRLAFKLQDWNASNLVLGNLSASGYDASTFQANDLGIGYLVGDGAEPTVVRFAYVDGVKAGQVITRARALRKRQGLLAGYAVGADLEVDDEPETAPLQHIADVWPGDRPRVTYSELAERLEDRHPDAYANWTGRQVSTICSAAGLAAVQVKKDGVNQGRGIVRDNLFARLADDHLGTEPDVERVEPEWPKNERQD